MAPKAKAADKAGGKAASAGKAKSAEPPAKGAAEGAAKVDPVLLAKHKKIFITCGVITVLSLVLMVLMVSNYMKLKERRRPINQPFRNLRSSLATAVNEQEFLKNKPKEVAEELQLLPSKIEKSKKLYSERKSQYRSLFAKSGRSSSGPWDFHEKSLYYFSKGEKSWYEAENFCIARGAHLASVLNEEEQNFITSQLQHTSWIGLTTENEEGKWRWSDGSKLVTKYWSEGQPSNPKVFGKSNQHCAMMVPSLRYHNWKDNYCHKRYRWVCKENLDLGEQ